MNIEKINSYISSLQDNIHQNIIYCFKSEKLKTEIKHLLSQGDISQPFYTEIYISDDKLEYKNSPIFIYGEYIKLSRDMTQTPLKIKGKLKCTRSVSDFKYQIKEFFDSKDVVFIPSGREDIDVRMISGRPFILKVLEPKRNLKFDRLKLKLYKEIDIINCKHVTRSIKDIILEGERDKTKIYQTKVVCKGEILFQKEYHINQKTPLRVLHRRANLVREKAIEILEYEKYKCELLDNEKYKCELLDNEMCESNDKPLSKEISNTQETEILRDNPSNIFKDTQMSTQNIYNCYIIRLKASAGAYIKEFVNGDFGRTNPSLSTKDNPCELLELDVLEVERKEICKEYIISEIHLEKEY